MRKLLILSLLLLNVNVFAQTWKPDLTNFRTMESYACKGCLYNTDTSIRICICENQPLVFKTNKTYIAEWCEVHLVFHEKINTLSIPINTLVLPQIKYPIIKVKDGVVTEVIVTGNPDQFILL